MNRRLTVYIGFDSSNYGQQLAYDVCERSIRKFNEDVKIVKLIRQELKYKNIYTRTENSGSTEFTYTRFLAPYLNNYEDYALFCDSDFLWECDVMEVLENAISDKSINNFSVWCVKHDYTSCNGRIKMDGKTQEYYPRKNWSSLMLFNCSHPDVKNLNIKSVSEESPAWLHRMKWTNDDSIGEIDKSYNYLVGYYNDNNIKALHFTDGGPWHPGYEKVEHGEKWLSYLKDSESIRLNKNMKVNL
tara:strand:- start:280 stop:1011 length:732 start_codon:yes stop_codon:yes gene_type:complete